MILERCFVPVFGVWNASRFLAQSRFVIDYFNVKQTERQNKTPANLNMQTLYAHLAFTALGWKNDSLWLANAKKNKHRTDVIQSLLWLLVRRQWKHKLKENVVRIAEPCLTCTRWVKPASICCESAISFFLVLFNQKIPDIAEHLQHSGEVGQSQAVGEDLWPWCVLLCWHRSDPCWLLFC